MRRYWVVALAVLTLLGVLSPPAFAQAPAPKVTINGLIDFNVSFTSNREDTDVTRKEATFYSRERGRLDIIGEVGKAKMVWGIELDFVNGHTVTGQPGTSGTGFDLDTDVNGFTETKWLYVEFPFAGPDSLLPFIPMPTVARGGAQPFVGHDYKFGILASGDFGGVTLISTVTPNIKNTLTFAQIEERTASTEDPARRLNRDSWALLESFEVTPVKGLTVKPTFSIAQFGGQNQGSATLLATPTRAGGAFGGGGAKSWRGTVGGDARWTMGPWSFVPTFHYQFGEQQLNDTCCPGLPTTTSDRLDISAWIVDVEGGWRQGPLNLEARFTYTTGNDASDVNAITVSNQRPDINFYTPINPGFAYYTGWSEIWTSGTEYNNALLAGSSAMGRRQSIGYDVYGLLAFAVRATYAVTPALSLIGIVHPSWTAEDVPTQGFWATTGITPPAPGVGKKDETYLGTEVVAGFTWRFAPNLAFNARYAHLFAGDALNQCQTSAAACSAGTGQVRKADDVDLITSQVRFTF